MENKFSEYFLYYCRFDFYLRFPFNLVLNKILFEFAYSHAHTRHVLARFLFLPSYMHRACYLSPLIISVLLFPEYTRRHQVFSLPCLSPNQLAEEPRGVL
jgi:hypothetical protein